jgi:hypothetical protein
VRVHFVTGNRWRHTEAHRLLAGVDVSWVRRSLAKPPGESDLAVIAEGRARDAFRQLGEPCFVENTSLELEGHGSAQGAQFKRLLL